jgi:hypothetical protein
MSSYEKMREEIIWMQSYASQRPQTHDALLTALHKARAELERLMSAK